MAARSTVLALCLALCVVPSLAAYDFDTILNQKSLQSGDVRARFSTQLLLLLLSDRRRLGSKPDVAVWSIHS